MLKYLLILSFLLLSCGSNSIMHAQKIFYSKYQFRIEQYEQFHSLVNDFDFTERHLDF